MTTLAPAGAVLPHEDAAPNLLADQASHLTLSAPSAASAASLTPVGDSPHRSIASPIPSDSRRRACSACSCSAQHPASERGDAHGSPGAAGGPPPAPRHARTRASAPSVAIEPPGLPVTPANGAQRCSPSLLPPSPPTTSHKHASGARDKRFDDGVTGQAGHRVQPADGLVDVDAGPQATAIIATAAAMALALAPHAPTWQRNFVWRGEELNLADLPNEVLLHVLGYLDVCDLLATSRVSAVKLPCCACLLLFCILLDVWVLSCLLSSLFLLDPLHRSATPVCDIPVVLSSRLILYQPIQTAYLLPPSSPIPMTTQ